VSVHRRIVGLKNEKCAEEPIKIAVEIAWLLNLVATKADWWRMWMVAVYRACQLYKNISMLFLFPVKDGKLSTGVNATFDASCYG